MNAWVGGRDAACRTATKLFRETCLLRDAVRHGTDVHARVRGSKGTGDDARPRQGVSAAAIRHNDNA